MSRNLAASIRARLNNLADARKQDYNLVLTHYGLERLLYRLSVSEHSSRFLLKGALLFSLWYDLPHRPTRDAVTPAPESVRYPVMLDDLPVPELRAYPKYTVVAEKVHVICTLGLANSRMKDYFDLWMLLRENDLDAAELRRAIAATFERRKTSVSRTLPVGLSEAFATDPGKLLQWQAFLRKNRLAALSLAEVVEVLRSRLESIAFLV